MSLLAVDLASTAWAAYLGNGGKSTFSPSEATPDYVAQIDQFSALDFPTESEAVAGITDRFSASFMLSDTAPEALVIEDQPHGIRWDLTAKNVARMQGRIVQQMATYGAVERLLFVQPVVWQSALGVWRKTPQETALVAQSLGYTPPDLITIHECSFKNLKGKDRQKVRTRLKKIETDYVDSFLVYAWAVKLNAAGALWSPNKGIQHYTR